MYPENQRIIPTLFVGAGIGSVVWGFVPGLVHFLVSIDFGAMNSTAISVPFRLMAVLWIMGAFLGVMCQFLGIVGGFLRSKGLIVFAPMLAGTAIGMIQGFLMPSPLFGLKELGFAFRSPELRIIVGAIADLQPSPRSWC
jgi:hypothetical protein